MTEWTGTKNETLDSYIQKFKTEIMDSEPGVLSVGSLVDKIKNLPVEEGRAEVRSMIDFLVKTYLKHYVMCGADELEIKYLVNETAG